MALEKNIKSVVHFMAYPGPRLGRSTQLGEAPESYMVDTIKKIIDDPYFNGIEITLIKDPAIRKRVAKMLKDAKMYVTFCAQSIQLINEDNLIATTDISSIDELERQNAVARILEYVDMAVELGAQHFELLSGDDPGTSSGLAARRQATRQLVRSLNEICRYTKKKAGGMKVSLVMFDRLEGSKPQHKGQLIGPTSEAVLLGEELKLDYGHDHFGLLYDLSHMFLMRNGFDHETPEVLRQLAPYLNAVHIANSVSSDPSHPDYGDMHVAMDHPMGSVTPEVLSDFVKVLNEINFSGLVGFELLPRGRQISESVINIAKSMFQEACAQIPVNYAIGGYRFKARKFLPERFVFRLTDIRMNKPEIIAEGAKNRVKRKKLAKDGRMVIIAADHPGRNVTSVGDDPYLMGDRQQYLGRITRALMAPHVDGIMTTPDIMDELFIINFLMQQKDGGTGILDDKILIGCTNRGGLSGSMYEMDDRVTAYKIADIKKLGLDGAKMMFRLDLKSPQSRYSQYTVERCSELIRKCNDASIPAFIEPLPVEIKDGQYQVIMDSNEIIRAIGVATALGGSSQNIWLKVPYVDNFEMVARSTSCPILMLGGASTGDPTGTIENFEKGIGSGSNICGAMVGRNMLYPGFDDPYATSAAVGKVIHELVSAEDAVKYLASLRGKDIDLLVKALGA
ncbi:MAG: Cgl0159 family (beta/alpha)8-fold protein [Promethearchaeota archaeon]